jgi:hypothetical protein
LGVVDWFGQARVPYPFTTPNEGNVDLPQNKEYLGAAQLLLGHTKLESTIRYLGIKADDALEIAEQTKI